jgi:hypothetical protein
VRFSLKAWEGEFHLPQLKASFHLLPVYMLPAGESFHQSVLVARRKQDYPARNKVVFLLSVRAGLRAKEIAFLTWGMLTDAQGTVSDAINLQNVASKGKSGGTIWLNKELKIALEDYGNFVTVANANDTIIRSERGDGVSAQVIVNMTRGWYKQLGFDGCRIRAEERLLRMRPRRFRQLAGQS